MNARTEREALNLILVTYVLADEARKRETEAAVKATLEKARSMGILETEGASVPGEIMNFYLEECMRADPSLLKSIEDAGRPESGAAFTEHPGPGVVCSCPICVPGKYAR